MKMTKFVTMLMLIATPMVALAHQGNAPQNEDMQWIKSWVKDQKAAEIAAILNLDAAQVATLRDIKASVEGVKAEFEPRMEALAEQAATTAADVRARIEATGILSDEDKALLKDLRVAKRNLGKERRLSMQLATIGLEDVLSEDQVAQLRTLMQQRRDDHEPQAGEGQGQGPRQGQQGQRQGGEQQREKGKQRIARLLLSDAFLAAYP